MGMVVHTCNPSTEERQWQVKHESGAKLGCTGRPFIPFKGAVEEEKVEEVRKKEEKEVKKQRRGRRNKT